jgi:hypothetical protein
MHRSYCDVWRFLPLENCLRHEGLSDASAWGLEKLSYQRYLILKDGEE